MINRSLLTTPMAIAPSTRNAAAAFVCAGHSQHHGWPRWGGSIQRWRLRLRRVVGCLALLLALLLLGAIAPLPASAAIRQLEEAPGQQVYQSRQSLVDQQGQTWQAIAFKRIRPNGETGFYLRLVGFPGTAAIDRSKPLALTSSMGQTLTAEDASGPIFTDASAPEPNVGQYDLQPLLARLNPVFPWHLRLPLTDQPAVTLSVPPTLVQEWQTVAHWEEA